MSSYTRGAPTVFFISAMCVLALRDWDAGGGDVPFVGGQCLGHPMLYFGREAVPELRRAGLGSHAHLAQQIRLAGEAMLSSPNQFLPPRDPQEFTARWNEIYGNNLCVLALFCLLYPQHIGALSLARQYMERMASQPSWLVRDAPWDEVPMAHSLVGFSTAYDFLYEFLSVDEQERYLHVIGNASLYMYEKSFQRGWSFQYLHNHQPTNCVALLISSLVLMNQGCLQEAYVYIKQLMSIMEKAVVVLWSIADGSLYEGVAYGSYSTRSLFQYVHLLQRHFNISHLSHPWFHQHFQFLYSTLLPGFQRSVAIGDSNYNWFYGPESQLMFLDRYIMRNGYANFLANQIRNHRVQDGPGQPARGQKWSTLHTEYIWYDAGLEATPPPDFGSPQLHYFEDWGVVTWGGALPAGSNHTFLSFKSGKLGGRAIFDIVHQQHYSEWIRGWKNFNTGHEHPDQNSFTFAPGGFPFITEGLYGPKYTLLNNALIFAPSLSGDCFFPWEGQVTESCHSKWSKYKSGAAADCQGRVEAALERMGVVFIRGEAQAAYSQVLKIHNLQRNLVLLQPDLLLLLDHAHLDLESPVRTMSAFFHNTDFPFQQTESHGVHGAFVQSKKDVYTMLWRDDVGDSKAANTSYFPYPHGYPYNGTHFVNVTTPLRRPYTRIAYIFFGPSVVVQSFSLHGDSERIDVHLTTQDHTFTVHILTSQSPSKHLFAMVLMDQKYKITFAREAGRQERPLEVVKDYVKVVQQNLLLVKPVFQQMKRCVQGQILNPDGFHRITEQVRNLENKKKKLKRKKKAAVAKEMFSIQEKINDKIQNKVRRDDKEHEVFSQIKEHEKKQRDVKQKSDLRGFKEKSDVYWHKKDGVVNSRVFNEVPILKEKNIMEASDSVSYIRLFLLVNMAVFFLLLAVLLTQFQRAPSLQMQRCIYCILLLDSFVLLSLYSSCSQGHC